MKLISINIETDLHYDTLFPFLENEKPDVICMQEVIEDQFEMFKNKLGMKGVFKPCGFSDSGYSRYASTEGKRYGVAIFSKEFIDSGHYYYWGSEDDFKLSFEEYIKDEKNTENYVFVWVNIKKENGDIYKFVSTHFPATKKGESTPHQLEILPPLFEKLDSFDGFVMCGDFNAPRGRETFRRISDKYKDNIPSHYETSIDNKIHRDGVQNITLMVDGLFTTPAYIAKDVRLVDGVSDHMAVVAEIEKI